MRKVLFVLRDPCAADHGAVIAPRSGSPRGSRCDGQALELAEASGTLWNGSPAGADSSRKPARTGDAAGAARLELSPWSLLVGNSTHVDASFRALAALIGARALIGGGTTTLSATTLRVPASLLSASARRGIRSDLRHLLINWTSAVRQSPRTRQHQREWQYASSALTPVSPMGHYRCKPTCLAGNSARFIDHFGTLELKGVAQSRRVGACASLAGHRHAGPTGRKAQLTGLISLLGRETERGLLNFGG